MYQKIGTMKEESKKISRKVYQITKPEKNNNQQIMVKLEFLKKHVTERKFPKENRFKKNINQKLQNVYLKVWVFNTNNKKYNFFKNFPINFDKQFEKIIISFILYIVICMFRLIIVRQNC